MRFYGDKSENKSRPRWRTQIEPITVPEVDELKQDVAPEAVLDEIEERKR